MPELQDRCSDWLRGGDGPGDRVIVLSARRLRAVLAAAVRFALPKQAAARLRLLSSSVQLRAYFGRIFPALTPVAATSGSDSVVGRLGGLVDGILSAGNDVPVMVACHTAAVDQAFPRTSACVIRIEGRGTSDVTVTLRANVDISDPEREWVVRTVDVERAKLLVMCFFKDCLHRG